MTTKFVNISLFTLMVTLFVSGLLTLVFSAGAGWLFALHRLAGVGVVLLLPWKTLIAWRSLRRRFGNGAGRAFALGVSLPLAGLVLLTLSLVLAWTVNWVEIWSFWGYPAMLLHWYAALLLLPFFGIHVYMHWYPRPSKGLLNTRRQFLRAGLVGLGTLFAWRGLTIVADALQALNELRRFSGSREVGSFTGTGMPITSMIMDNPVPVDVDAWRLTLTGRVCQPLGLSYADLQTLPQTTLLATLDCTDGWYSTQRWTGVSLGDLLARAGVGSSASGDADSSSGLLVRVTATTGHNVTLPLAQAREAVLATTVSGMPLDHAHGAPLRLAHPALRGWLWIKWAERIEVLRVGELG